MLELGLKNYYVTDCWINEKSCERKNQRNGVAINNIHIMVTTKAFSCHKNKIELSNTFFKDFCEYIDRK